MLDPLLGCISIGIWAEAREAAATIANLMWLPDLSLVGTISCFRFLLAEGADVTPPHLLL